MGLMLWIRREVFVQFSIILLFLSFFQYSFDVGEERKTDRSAFLMLYREDLMLCLFESYYFSFCKQQRCRKQS